jgi:hypothetical protein
MITAQAPRLLPNVQETKRCVWKVEDNSYIGKVNAICQGGCRDNCRRGGEELVELFLLVQKLVVVARKVSAFGKRCSNSTLGVVSNCFNTPSGAVYHVVPRFMNVVLKLYLRGYPVKWIQQQL